ncbi:hypothetical protein FNV43_RR22561 [Rhamnella rubrinervis]|uniref:Uncharacterized protein n=1 Tax=Rhamnella rubrinervis TaxID=2594499 RepID=A0A8K0E275_9ROSA|nr:hypothetical protein FNV43_RR22561 [Rhamnella rubrinervis]
MDGADVSPTVVEPLLFFNVFVLVIVFLGGAFLVVDAESSTIFDPDGANAPRAMVELLLFFNVFVFIFVSGAFLVAGAKSLTTFNLLSLLAFFLPVAFLLRAIWTLSSNDEIKSSEIVGE